MSMPFLIFLTVTIGVAATYQLLTGLLFADATRMRSRVAEEFRKGASGAAQTPLFKNLDRLSVDPRSGGLSDLGLAEMPGAATGPRTWSVRLQELLDQASIRWPLPRFLALVGALAAVGAALGFSLNAALLSGPLTLAGALSPFGYVLYRRKVRRERFLAQLPGAFELMARVLRAGHSVPQSLQGVVESMEEPIAGEFAHCQKQQNLGLRAEVTFQDLARRTGIVEMRIFVMALLIQRQVGGNLSDVLERLAMLIRSRLRLRKQVRTLTAEGRLQGLTLLVLPFLLLGALFCINRSYVMVLFDHVPLLLGTGFSMLVGALWIRKIVNFEA